MKVFDFYQTRTRRRASMMKCCDCLNLDGSGLIVNVTAGVEFPEQERDDENYCWHYKVKAVISTIIPPHTSAPIDTGLYIWVPKGLVATVSVVEEQFGTGVARHYRTRKKKRKLRIRYINRTDDILVVPAGATVAYLSLLSDPDAEESC